MAFFNFDTSEDMVNAQINVLDRKYYKWAYNDDIHAERKIRTYFMSAMSSYCFHEENVNPKNHPAAKVLDKYVKWLNKKGYRVGYNKRKGIMYAVSPRNTVVTKVPRKKEDDHMPECISILDVIMASKEDWDD